MENKNHSQSPKTKIGFIFFGLSSFVWLIFRSAKKPSRLQYPCQKLAATNSIAFLTWLGSVFGGHLLYRRSEKLFKKLPVLIVIAALVFSGARIYQVWQDGLKPKTIWGQASSSRVVWITNSSASSGSYNPSNGDQTKINQMMDNAIMALTGQSSVRNAWTTIFQTHNGGADYIAGEKIAIKVNFNNDYDCTNNGCPLYKVANALLRQLADPTIGKGIAQSNIGLYDTSRSFPDYYFNGISSAFPNVQLDPDNNSWPACTVGESVRGAPFGCWLAGAKYLINMPLLRTHGMAGVTLSFKNHLGSTSSPSSFHGAFFNTSASTNSLVQLNSHTFIRNKTILVVDDAIYGLTSGGPGGFPDIQPNSLFLSTDPVAIDSVMIDYLESLDANFGGDGSDPRTAYWIGAQAGLGNYATSCNDSSCSFSYSNIELIRCPSGTCLGTTPQPTSTPTPPVTISPTRTPTPSPTRTPTPTRTLTPTPSPSCLNAGDINCDRIVNATDILAIFSNWLLSSPNPSRADTNSDRKVNGFDFSLVRYWLGR